jgi:3-phosphoshikimate 1-carboxyvinyltransferase
MHTADPGTPLPLTLRADGPLLGAIVVPGDKSISHRALLFASLAVGASRITGLLEGEDVLRTAAALGAMGASIVRHAPGQWEVHGTGVGSLLQPETALDMGNSGTSTRLLMGLVASHPVEAMFVGDASLSRRPMARVMEPLRAMGAAFDASPGDRLPLKVRGTAPAIPIRYRMPVASAQVKSAVLIAGLNALGDTTVVEAVPTRDHSERMLKAFGAEIERRPEADGSLAITVHGPATLRPADLVVPGDPSSAAFPMVAALLVPGSEVRINGVGLNPTRDGLVRVLEAMGASIERANPREVGGEPVADLLVRASSLTGISPPPDVAPSMIDEFPALFVAAAHARGRSVFRGLGELRVKESDRIAVMAQGLHACGARVEELEDGLAIEGSGGDPLAGGATVASHLDHRIAMSFAILSLATRAPITIDDARPVATSFPGFVALMEALGARTAA